MFSSRPARARLSVNRGGLATPARHAACVSVWDCEPGNGSRKVCERQHRGAGGAMRMMSGRIRLAAGLIALAAAPASGVAETVLRFIPQADLRSLDPIWTTAYVTRNFGYLVFDTLFALDKEFKPQPQMVDSWTVSDDKLTYKFTLRDGLKWHDGQPVRAADCIASIERWAKRDQFGQKMMEAVGSMTADGDKNFTVALKAPFPLLLSALRQVSSH